MEFLTQYYTGILAFHIIAVMSWMTLLFYMPRLFVYHVENIDKKDFVEVVKIQEDKIYNIIGYPAMIATLLSGGLMLFLNQNLLNQPWMLAKLVILVFMILYTLSLKYFRLILLEDKCTKNGQFFRAYNEVPTILAILIVTFVITKSIPFYFSVGITLFFSFVIYKILTKK
jgi:putative membrane protein